MKLRFGECVLDTDERSLLRNGRETHLTPKAYQLLLFLVDARPRAVSKAELQDKLWPDTFVSEGNLPSLVNEARGAIGDDARQPVFIRTVHGYGYSFAGTVDADTRKKSRSILVLPFANLSGNHELDYLCDGIAENLTNAFSRVAGLRVLSPRTGQRWKGSSEEPEAIGRQLDVETVVHGRAWQVGDHLAIQVDAVDVASATQIWGNRFRATAQEMYRIEEDVAAEVADALRVRLSDDDLSLLVHRYTSNPHAYDLYLRGRFHWNKRTEEGLKRALQQFERASVADPEYALPHAGIADVYVSIGSRDLMAPSEAFPRALQSATRALELAPGLAQSYTSLGAIAEVHYWDWEEAGRKYRRSIEISPSYATAYEWYALHFARRGLAMEAERQMAGAINLDPLSVSVLTNAALVSYLARDHVVARERIDRAIDIEPENVGTLLVRGVIRESSGDLAGAINDYRLAVSRSARYTMSLAALGHALGRQGDRSAAEQTLRTLGDLRGTQHVSAIDFALIHVGLGEFDRALDWFDAAVVEKSGWLTYLGTDPRVDVLRSHSRFRSLLALVGLGEGVR